MNVEILCCPAKPLTAARVMFQALLVFAPKLNENLPQLGNEKGRGGLIFIQSTSIRDRSRPSTRNSSGKLRIGGKMVLERLRKVDCF